MKRTFLIVATLLLSLLGSFAYSQTVTLTPSVTSGNGSLSTRLTWSTTPAATSCTASGHASWTGTKAASGAVDLPAITLSGSYPLTLTCTWSGESSVTVNWVAPITNTDGGALTKCASATTTGPCLAYFRVYRRLGSADLANNAEVTPVNDPNATSYTLTNLPAGVHYVAVEVVNGNGVPSILSNVASKTLTGSVTRTESVTVTVNPKPSPAAITLQ
jgi:hypothetical protein